MVESKLLPGSAITSFFPLMVIFTSPEGDKNFFDTRSTITSNKIMPKNTPILVNIKEVIILFFFQFYILNPEKHIKAIAINPTTIKVIPNPLNGAGTLE